ncbi:MAG TPA: YHS domain-containing (seleno)protein [Burkholderiales bacterium]|nr:YHS domain-containing (seleno)protein [Burkholderiales bacterium]
MLVRALVLVAAASLAAAALAQKPPVFSDREGAIGGYDPVAFFTFAAAIKGSPRITHQWRGATWHFAHSGNRDAFAADPEKYAPQYGGYCAYGVAQGYVVGIDPAAWTVVGDKLYFNYSPDVRRTWRQDVPGYVRKADANWPEVLR